MSLQPNPLGSKQTAGPSKPMPSRPAPKPAQSAPPSKIGIFGKRQHLYRGDLRDSLRRDTGIIPKSYRKYNPKESLELEKEFPGDKYFASRTGIEKRIKQLKREVSSMPSWNEKTVSEKIGKEERIRYSERLLNG